MELKGTTSISPAMIGVFSGIHSMELKEGCYRATSHNDSHLNPFNGIERAILPSKSDSMFTFGIHSMELKVLIRCDRNFLGFSLVKNPFNGIERYI